MWSCRVGLAGILVCWAGGAWGQADKDDLGARVRKFAHGMLGKKVGDGECATLAVRALRAAGAKTTADFRVVGPGRDYVWGRLVKSLADAKPGDVLQYRNFKITTTTRTADGVWMSNVFYPQHTAIVSANLGKGKLKVLEQNAEGKKLVQENEVDLGGKLEGKVWLYRPVRR